MLLGWGGMAVLDRSWYGCVLVEPVEGFATEEQWRRAYREIVDFERTLADEGMIMVKFWLHLSSGEQLRPSKARQRDPLKTWKRLRKTGGIARAAAVSGGRGGYAGPN